VDLVIIERLKYQTALLILFCVFVFTPSLSIAKIDESEAFREMAYELIKGIDRTGRPVKKAGAVEKTIWLLKKRFNQNSAKRLRIAVWPYEADKLPVSKDKADEFNDHLLVQLQDLAGGRYDFVARETLALLIDDMDNTGALDAAGGNPINALMKKAQNFDFLITGRMSRDSASVTLTYKATRTDGILAATTTPRSLPYLPPAEMALGLDQAVKKAARRFVDAITDMEVLVLGGIRYGDSRTQPPFGRRLQDRLSEALLQNINNGITGKMLLVRDLKTQKFQENGRKVDPKSLTNKGMVKGKGAYVLDGIYWELPHSVEVKLRLRNPAGNEVRWIGRIRMEDIQGFGVRPKNSMKSPLETELLGPFAFHLTTNRGEDPAYSIGEYLNLLIRLDRDAWVYCFYQQSDASLIQIFPNPQMNSQEPRLVGDLLHTIPGETTFPFKLKLTEPAGYEVLRCFATSRNVTAELPKDLQGKSLGALPPGTEHRLASVFSDLPNVKVSEKQLVITVTSP